MYAIRKAELADLERLRQFFHSAKVPYNNVDLFRTRFFFVEKMDERRIVSTIGVEIYRSVGLLRSFVIDPSTFQSKVFVSLMEILFSYLKYKSIQKIYLFTEIGDQIFQEWGFKRISSEKLPYEVIQSEYAKNIQDRGVPMECNCSE